MKRYTVEFTDEKTGATSAIDTFEERDGYTAADYIEDCKKNADAEWVEMLEGGEVEIREIED